MKTKAYTPKHNTAHTHIGRGGAQELVRFYTTERTCNHKTGAAPAEVVACAAMVQEQAGLQLASPSTFMAENSMVVRKSNTQNTLHTLGRDVVLNTTTPKY